MQLVHIFGPDESLHAGEGLWAVRYEPGTGNAFDDLWDQWEEVDWWWNFCRDNLEDVQTKFGYPISVEDAVEELMDEVDWLMQEIVDLAEGGRPGHVLQKLFMPLDNRQPDLRVLQLSKASAKERFQYPKIRIYAVRVDAMTYVVTGGAVKLTDKMDERSHTRVERENLEKVGAWLRGLDIGFPEDLIDRA